MTAPWPTWVRLNGRGPQAQLVWLSRTPLLFLVEYKSFDYFPKWKSTCFSCRSYHIWLPTERARGVCGRRPAPFRFRARPLLVPEQGCGAHAHRRFPGFISVFHTLCFTHTPKGVCRGQQVCPGLGSSGTPPLPRLLALRAAASVLGTRSGYERRWGAGGRAGVTGCFRKLSVLVMPLSVSQRARLGSLPTACQPPWQPGD